jgi:RNA polymerase sigma-70 factor (ECF subfamily)
MWNDEEILNGCKKDDRKAQEQLYRKYAPVLLGILCRYSRSREEAEDLLQEGFIKIFKNIHQYREEGPLLAWMRRIMINTAIRHYQSTLEEQRNVRLKDSMERKIADQDLATLNFSAEDILKVMQMLPEGFRVVFNLYAIEGYKHKEIAKRLGISVNTSKSQYARARKFLKKLFLKMEKGVLVSFNVIIGR